jgi:hypothetical protein
LNVLPFLPIIALLPFIAVLVRAFMLFDELIRAEYEHHRSAWEADRRPSGFFWRAPQRVFLVSQLARQRLAYSLLFRTPPWIAGSPALVALLRRFRIAVLVWNIAALILLVIFLWVLPNG